MRFLDTDVMLDILKGHEPAVAWLESLEEDTFALSGYVIMELMMACRTQEEVDTLYEMLEPFWVVWPSEDTSNDAMLNFSQRHREQKLGLLDALIGEGALEHEGTLCTLNPSRYKAIEGLHAVEPYKS